MHEARIGVRGIALFAYHGLERVEAQKGAPFEIDFDIYYREPRASRNDTLKGRPDYAKVAYRVVELFSKKRFRLIEPLCAMIAETMLAEFKEISRFRIVVRKLAPALTLSVASSETEIVRSRC